MQLQESETIELKAVMVDDVKKEIIAFANGEGGKLYIGVQDDGTVLGLENPDATALQVSNMIRDAVKPDLTMFLHYETIIADGKYVLVIDIQRGSNRPYYLAKKGLRPEGVYVRQGYSSVPATDTAIRRMIKETDGDSFEEMRSLVQELTFEDAKKEFSERNISFGPIQKKTLGIINPENIYTNLGLLLSDQCVHTVKAAVYEGTNQSVFKDRKEFSGSLLRQMREIYDYIDFHNQNHATYDKLRRIDCRDYPEIAVREALMNSLIHREYSFRASTLISIFEDRIEFTSIGGLVFGVTQSDIIMGISVCRNEKLANIFYRLELIEAYGTGIRKILDAYAQSGRMPRIETSDNAFKIILPNLNTFVKKAITTDKYNDSSEKVLQLVKQQGFVMRKEVEHLLGIGQTSSGRILRQLVDQGLLIQVGNGRTTRYRTPQP